MKKPGILVTGGAGYIGSHTVKALGANDENIVVLDNLVTGFSDAVTCGKLIVGDTGDSELLKKILRDYNVDTVIHFAAHTIVPESVENPLKYYWNNSAKTLALLRACADANVKHFVFSSTAAVYGIPEGGHCREDSPTQPINPYGSSKLVSEMMLRDLCAASDLRAVVLRYFNVAGSDPDGEIGQSTRKATLLVKVAAEAAVGKRKQVYIYGTDYPTPDGTGIRDYIHVTDLANAHVSALRYLRNGGETTTLNCGYGHGYSVRDVLATMKAANDGNLTIIEDDRRAGDPPVLVADVARIGNEFDWTPKYDDLEFIVKTSLDWERKLVAANG